MVFAFHSKPQILQDSLYDARFVDNLCRSHVERLNPMPRSEQDFYFEMSSMPRADLASTSIDIAARNVVAPIYWYDA
jgi:hypothetical protein